MSRRGILSDGARAHLLGSTSPAEWTPAADARAALGVPAPGRATELIDAAVAEFVDKGYTEVGVREITERAGVSHGTFYNYFDSKRHMLSVLVERNRAAMLARLEGAAGLLDDPVTPAGVLRAVSVLNLTVLQDLGDRLDEFRFLMLEVPGVDGDAFDQYLELYGEARSAVAAILAPAAEAGLIDSELDVDLVAEAWLGYLLGVVAATANAVDVTGPAESAHVVTSLLLGGAQPQ